MPSALRPVFVVDALRTPIGRYAGGLASVRPDDLAAHVISALVARQPELASRLDQVVFGAANQAGEDNRNVARMALLIAGLPYEVPGVTVNRLCGSGLEAVADAARMIATGEAECAIAGGVESMTRAPFTMPKQAERFERTPPTVYDTTLGWRYPNPRLRDRFELLSMGETAENVAKKYAIHRDEQDRFALSSHERAAAAWAAGDFAAEVVPVPIPLPSGAPPDKPAAPRAPLSSGAPPDKPAAPRAPLRKGEPVPFERDESVRADSSLEALAKLRPAFREGGTVTAGNSSPINDGAAALLLASGDAVQAAGVSPIARLVATATAGVDPNFMGEGPIPAVKKLLQRTGLRVPNVDLFELNEAFAAQALACVRALELDLARVNVRGGAIALGHPIGCSGARIACTLIHAMRARGARVGVASLCIGVGQGIASLFEAV